MKGQAIIEERMRCNCAAIATAAVAVGTAAYGAYSQNKQANAQEEQARQAQEQLQKNKEGAYGSKVVLPDYQDRVVNPLQNFQQSLPMITAIGGRMNQAAINQRNKLAGGQLWQQNIQQAGRNVQQMMGGNIPADVQDRINRYVAERGGGAYDPTQPGGYGGGLSQVGGDMARSLGKTSYDIMTQGMSYAPGWAQMVDQFTYKPQDVLRDTQTFQNEAQLQLQRDQNLYQSQANQAFARAQADPQVAGFMNDQLRLQGIQQQAEANKARAMEGLITAGGQALTAGADLYSRYNAPAPRALPTGRTYNPSTKTFSATPVLNRSSALG